MGTLHTAKASFYLPGYTVPGYNQSFPDDDLFNESFESGGATGWVAGANSTGVSTSTLTAHSGVRSLFANRTSFVDGVYSLVSKTFSGLTIGRTYRVSMWGAQYPDVQGLDVTAALYVTGTTPVYVELYGDNWNEFVTEFVASATTVDITLASTAPYTGTIMFWDDLKFTRLAYEVPVPATYVPPTGVPADVQAETATFTMDEEWAPFIQGSLKVADMDIARLESLDPREPTRMVVTLDSDSLGSKTMDDFNEYMIDKYGPTPTATNFNTEFASKTMDDFNAAWGWSYEAPAYATSWDNGSTDGWTSGGGIGTAGTSGEFSTVAGGYSLKTSLPSAGSNTMFKTVSGLTVGARYAYRLNRLSTAVGTEGPQSSWGVTGLTSAGNAVGTSGLWKEEVIRFTATLTSHQLFITTDRNPGDTIGDLYWDDVSLAQISDSGATLTLDLGIRSRTINYETGDVVFDLASDEALLIDTRRVAATAAAPATNTVDGCVSLAMASIGVANWSKPANINYPAVTQYSTNFEDLTIDGWLAASNVQLVNTNTAPGHSGSRTMGIRYLFAAPSGVRATRNIEVDPGYAHTASYWVFLGSAKSMGITVRGNGLSQTLTPVAVGTGVWTQINMGISASLTATGLVTMEINEVFAGTANSQSTWIDDIAVTRNSFIVNPNTLPVVADAALWQPGDAAWDYLEPILQANNLRLWCDESRNWHLDTPQTIIPGSTTITDTTNAVGITYGIDRDDRGWFDAAIVKYQWDDVSGISHVAYDTYADVNWNKAEEFSYDRPYPGAGAAQALVLRALKRGKAYDLRAVSDYGTYPGDSLSLKQVNKTTQTGFVKSVTWSFPEHEMRVETRGMADA